MKQYELPADIRASLTPHHRAVQGAIAVLANRRLGSADSPEGISKYEGGVIVNQREIAIHQSYVIDDWKKNREPTIEETAVVEAIAEVATLWKTGGRAAIERFPVIRMGDPLRDMLKVSSS